MITHEASPFWQGILFFSAFVLLLWEVWSGWRRGVLRSAVYFSAFVFSGFLGILAGQATGFVVEKILPGFGFLGGAFFGSIVTLLVLGLAFFLGAILFKRTAQQPSGVVRFFYGAGGAFFGLLTSLLLIWGGITIIRAFGVLAQTAIGNRPMAEAPSVAKSLIVLKDSLELGPAGKIAESVDVIPPSVYEMVTRIGKLTTDQDAMMRFLDYPGIQEVLQNPNVADLMNDPDIVRAAQNRDFIRLLGSPELLKTVNDPSLQKKLVAVDLQKALDYAFPTPQASPSPHQKP